jgi:Ca-activated chloride channel family protein
VKRIRKIISIRTLASATVLVLLFSVTISASPQIQPPNSKKHPRPQQLDQRLTFRRDPSTGELHVASPGAASDSDSAADNAPRAIQVVTQMVPVTCTVFTAEGDPVPGLTRADFRIFDNGVEQRISYFDASTQPASVALLIDASPSVLRDTDEMKRAADALIDALAPLDQAAVADFSAHTYLQLPFSDVRELVRRAVARVDPRQLLADTGGSNIYEAVYLVAHDLFPGRTGRKSIVLLTDGQDSGLGLTLDPETAAPRPGFPENRLTFDDVARQLAAEDIQLFAVSTEPRPKIMTPDWLASHAGDTLLTRASRQQQIPPYTLYLAELVRRAGGGLYFLHEKQTLADTFRDIASKIRAEYTLGFYPSASASDSAAIVSAGATAPVGPASADAAAPAGSAASSSAADASPASSSAAPASAAAASPSASGSSAAGATAPAPVPAAAAASGWHQLRVDLPAQADARASYRSSYYVPPPD